jgi:AmpD protein
LKVDIINHLLTSVHYLPSSHCDARPEKTSIDMIVIHGISLPPGEFGSGAVKQFFCDELDFSQHPYFSTIAHLKVSAHLFIDRLGGVTQFVPFSERAWHAGQSSFAGRSQCNDFSIGIELEGTDELPYEKVQYETLAQVIKALSFAYPAILRERIVGHADIAPGRKTDPGSAFDWSYLDCLLDA